MKEGIVLFAHGSRDPEWASPFNRLRSELAEKLPDAEVRLAFLELMQPSLGDALRALDDEGMEAIRVVPVFLGYGGHLKKDLPALVAAAKVKAEVIIDPPIGEQQSVIAAIATLVAGK